MTRRCSGDDENLMMYVDEHGERVLGRVDHEKHRAAPCDCGRVFDDARRSTIYPHEAL